MAAFLGFVALNGICAATAYVTHYRALELGPVAVVSPVGATYALVGVVLAIVFLGERPSLLALTGGVVTVVGVMLTSTDLRKLRAGTHGMPPGLPWAVASAIGFGVGGFLLGYLSQHLGWVVGMWASRMAQLAGFVPLGLARPEIARRATAGAGGDRSRDRGRRGGPRRRDRVLDRDPDGTRVDRAGRLGGVPADRGRALGRLSRHERPVPNQYAGIALVIGGLLMLGSAASPARSGVIGHAGAWR